MNLLTFTKRALEENADKLKRKHMKYQYFNVSLQLGVHNDKGHEYIEKHRISTIPKLLTEVKKMNKKLYDYSEQSQSYFMIDFYYTTRFDDDYLFKTEGWFNTSESIVNMKITISTSA